MLNKLSQGLQYLVQLIKNILTMLLHNDFTITLVLAGLCLALPYLVTGEPLAVFPLAVFLILCLIPVAGYLITTMRTYGWRAQVEVSVDIGVLFGVMVLILLTAVSLLALSLSCMS